MGFGIKHTRVEAWLWDFWISLSENENNDIDFTALWN